MPGCAWNCGIDSAKGEPNPSKKTDLHQGISVHSAWSVTICHQQQCQRRCGVSCGFGTSAVGTSESLGSVDHFVWHFFILSPGCRVVLDQIQCCCDYTGVVASCVTGKYDAFLLCLHSSWHSYVQRGAVSQKLLVFVASEEEFFFPWCL